MTTYHMTRKKKRQENIIYVYVNDEIQEEFYNYRFPLTKEPKGPLHAKLILRLLWPQEVSDTVTCNGL